MGARQFIEFVPVAKDDSYPAYVSDRILFDIWGDEVGFQVCHAESVILVSPAIAPQYRGCAVQAATLIARETYPLRLLNLPFAGEVA